MIACDAIYKNPTGFVPIPRGAARRQPEGDVETAL